MARCVWLEKSVAHHFSGRRIAVEPFREGVDCWVDLVVDQTRPVAVVRTARSEILHTSYEGVVDFRDTVEKEVGVASLLREVSIPTPEVLAWNLRSDEDPRDRSWVVYEYVPHIPCSEVPESVHEQLGFIASRIHAIRPGADETVAVKSCGGWESHVIDRILQRLSAARRYMELPPLEEIRSALTEIIAGRESSAGSLLHLDLRAPNLAIVDGRIAAILDLSNAMVGDPVLELSRLRACGLLSERFWRGYAWQEKDRLSVHELLDAYELDISALLVVVSREEFSDPVLHENMKARTRELLERLKLWPRAMSGKEEGS